MTEQIDLTDTPSRPGIDLRDITVRYGDRTAVDNVSLNVAAGQVTAIIGGNGAGKSTLLAVASGQLVPDEGHITIGGTPPFQQQGLHLSLRKRGPATHRIGVGYCPDRDGLFTAATVREHIAIVLRLTGQESLWPDALLLADRLELDHVLDIPTARFSHGMSRRASVLLACLGADPALLLDEPFDGMDIRGASVTANLISQAAAAGRAAIVTTHLPEHLDGVADRAIVMRAGVIVHDGEMNDIVGVRGRALLRRLLDVT